MNFSLGTQQKLEGSKFPFYNLNKTRMMNVTANFKDVGEEAANQINTLQIVRAVVELERVTQDVDNRKISDKCFVSRTNHEDCRSELHVNFGQIISDIFIKNNMYGKSVERDGNKAPPLYCFHTTFYDINNEKSKEEYWCFAVFNGDRKPVEEYSEHYSHIDPKDPYPSWFSYLIDA